MLQIGILVKKERFLKRLLLLLAVPERYADYNKETYDDYLHNPTQCYQLIISLLGVDTSQVTKVDSTYLQSGQPVNYPLLS